MSNPVDRTCRLYTQVDIHAVRVHGPDVHSNPAAREIVWTGVLHGVRVDVDSVRDHGDGSGGTLGRPQVG